MKKIAMLLSGGVDSSVALAFLKEQKFSITAYYLKIWLEDEMSYMGKCPWQEDLEYAGSVCDKLGVDFKVVSFQKEYFDRVVRYTIESVKNGLTPNPDIFCNTEVKFGAFLDKYGNKYDKIATGHYAQIFENVCGDIYLKSAPDPIKDQTYFLSMLSEKQLRKAMFPIGHLQKMQVREYASKFDLPTKNRKDSQGICFLGKISFTDFIKHYLGTKKGDFIDEDSGEVLGTHDGAYLYTIGQRKGINLGGGPWYVSKKDIKNNIVYLVHGFSQFDSRKDEFFVNNLNLTPYSYKLLNSKDIFKYGEIEVKLRHGANRYDCNIYRVTDKKIKVKLNKKDQGVTPGQFAVFYKKDLCLGGGVIC